MTDKLPFAYIENVAAGLTTDGYHVEAYSLRIAHEGIFSGLELVMKWRFEVENILKLKAISKQTRQSAVEAWNYFSDALD